MGRLLVKVTYTKDFEGLGAKIREYRKQSGKSLAQLAAAADISVPHWSRIENEKVGELPLSTLRSVEKALGVDLGVRFEELQ